MSPIQTTAIKLSPMRRLFAIMAALSLVLTGFTMTASQADASQSNTRLDPFGTLELAGSNWLGGIGANVYSNGSSAGYDSGQYNYVGSVQSGLKWQCVELVNRLYLQNGWITSRWTGNGGQMYDTAPGHLSKQLNGSITNLQAGDVVVFQDSGYGHVAVVSSISGNTVTTVNQNTQSVFISLTLNGGTLSGGLSGYSIKGVVHRPSESAGTSGYIGALKTNGHFVVKENSPSAPWLSMESGIQAISVSDKYIGALKTNGHFVVKENSPSAPWLSMESGIQAISVS